MGQELLTLQDISKYYTSGQSVVMGLSRVNLTFRAGEFVAITGESGSGKSTLAKIAAGILPYESGELLLAGSPTSHYDGSDWERYRRDSVSFISQSYDILPGCTVERNVISALRLTGMAKKDAAIRASEILREVELWEMRGRRAAKLSSGQKQRLSIARALAKPAPILIADEPTGNLDPENSAKVIELLAAAAKDRLVIMITHEFDEAAGLATRHITLQDGVVSSDTALRPSAQQTAAPVISRGRAAPRGLSLYTALLQVGSRPVWSSIMLVFFALTAFSVFAFLGTFIVNLDDTSTRIYDNSAFRNGDKERIVVIRTDGQPLTDEDIAALRTVSHLKSIERYGLVSDVNYFYREGVDYFPHYSAVGGSFFSDPTHVEEQITLELGNQFLFVETIPALAQEKEFLTAGRLPENMFEIVAGDESLLGQTFTVYIQDIKNWSVTSHLALDMTVVGTTDYGSHLYFDEQLGRSITTHLIHGSAFVIPDPEDADSERMQCSSSVFITLSNYVEQLAGPYEDGMTKIFFANRGSLDRWLVCLTQDGFQMRCFGSGTDDLVLKLSSSHSYNLLNSIVVSLRSYEQLVERGYSTQMCLYVDDYAYTDEVLDQLHALGYGAMSPYRLSSNRINETKAAERMQTLKVCLLALIAVVLLQIVVLRAMFSMEMEEYRLLANLGLRCKNARRSVLWQVVGFALSGESLAVIAIALSGAMKIERIASILRYLPAPYMLLTWSVHLAACLLTTVWIAHALRRQVYPISGIRADLTMEEEAEA